MSQQPSIGRIVHYKLNGNDIDQINRRRTNSASIAERMKRAVPSADGTAQPIYGWPAGAQAHIGNGPTAGDVVPLMIVRVWPDEGGPGILGVNGQCFLDGNDQLWVTSVLEGDAPGQWAWPPRA